MSIEYRSPSKSDWFPFRRALERGFGNHPTNDKEANDRWTKLFDSLCVQAALDGEEVVGTSAAHTRDTTIPGGTTLPAALVTMVTVAATHRRQGVLTNMMRNLLKATHEQGNPIATLWASESIIYGRFGYGMAGQHHWSKIISDQAVIAHVPEISGSVRFADRTRIREVGPDIWTRTVAIRPGMPDRNEFDWEGAHRLPEDDSKPEKKLFYAVYEENGRADGYIAYRTNNPGRRDEKLDIRVKELIATTDAAQAALHRFLLGIDLINEVTYPLLAADDPLWWMLADPRKLTRTPYDAIWLRILDVERTLSARTYSAECDLVFEVVDDFCPWAAGSYRLTSDASGKAECRETNDPADIVLPTASLSTCYFGSTKFANLVQAGRAEERTPGALAIADLAFAAEREPWCPMEY